MIDVSGSVRYSLRNGVQRVEVDRLENTSSNRLTGTIRLELWALSEPYRQGAEGRGAQLLAITPDINDRQLSPGEVWTNVVVQRSFAGPLPADRPFISLFVTEFDPQNTILNNGFVHRDFVNFDRAAAPPPPPPPAPPPSVSGSSGPDVLDGLSVAETMLGGAGDDVLRASGGRDFLDGGPGIDTVDYGAGGGSRGVTVNLRDGAAIDGFGDRDTLANIENAVGTAFADVFVGGPGGNRFTGRAGADLFNGEGGFDFVDYAAETGARGVVVNLTTGAAVDTHGARDRLVSIEGIVGTARADLFVGGAAVERFEGGAGNDVPRGGGPGGDVFIGGDGLDTVDYRFEAGARGVVVNLRDGAARDGFGALDRLFGVEAAVGGSGADVFVGGDGGESFAGMGGADVINGGGGFDFADYGRDDGRVVVNLGAGAAVDASGARDALIAIEGARGSRFADLLVGSNRVDRLEGGAGDDTLRGDGGADVLVGGPGADTILITARGWGADVLLDFEDGADRIAFVGLPGLDAFADLTVTQAGAATRVAFGADAVLLANTNRDTISTADFLFA